MFSQPYRALLILIATCPFGAGVAVSQDRTALFLPRDQQTLDDLIVTGTGWTDDLAGITRMVVPNSDITYYLVDEVTALQGEISDSLSNVLRNQSDIGIRFGTFGDEFAQLLFDGERFSLRSIKFDEALPIQLRRFFEEGGFANGQRSVEYLEYRISSGVCPTLDASVARMRAVLRNSMNGIGDPLKEDEVQSFTVDGAYYWLDVRMARLLVAKIGVGANAGPLFEAVHSFSQTLRECRVTIEPQVRASDF